jgi:hypothetical protein
MLIFSTGKELLFALFFLAFPGFFLALFGRESRPEDATRNNASPRSFWRVISLARRNIPRGFGKRLAKERHKTFTLVSQPSGVPAARWTRFRQPPSIKGVHWGGRTTVMQFDGKNHFTKTLDGTTEFDGRTQLDGAHSSGSARGCCGEDPVGRSRENRGEFLLHSPYEARAEESKPRRI